MLTDLQRDKLVKFIREQSGNQFAYLVTLGSYTTKSDVMKWLEILLEENAVLKSLVHETWDFPQWPAGDSEGDLLTSEQMEWIERCTELHEKIIAIAGPRERTRDAVADE